MSEPALAPIATPARIRPWNLTKLFCCGVIVLSVMLYLVIAAVRSTRNETLMVDSDSQVAVYHVVMNGTDRYYVVPLPMTQHLKKGLVSEAIMGTLKDGPEKITPESFAPNEVFQQFLAWVIAKHAQNCPGLVAEAKRQQDGWVYVLDGRTPDPNGDIPPEDIIGAVQIEQGRLLNFHSNPNHQLLTKNGFMKLERFLEDRLVEEILEVAKSNPE